MSDSENAWLIVLGPSVVSRPAYWGLAGDGELDWITDNTQAIRFARKIDAEKVIKGHGWTEAEATMQVIP